MTTAVEPLREGPWVPDESFAHRLRIVRQELGLKVEDIARLTGYAPATWSSWENGSRPRDRDKVVARVAEVTGVDRAWLMWGAITGSFCTLRSVPLEGQTEMDFESRHRELVAIP